MLKAYAVALVLTTSAPIAQKQAEGVKAADLQQSQTHAQERWKGKGKGPKF